jgi:hypothetical protein
MLWKLEELMHHISQVRAQIDGRWVPSRPLLWPWTWRIKLAWMVLRGKADAVVWPGGQ